MQDIETAAYMSDCSGQFRFVPILASLVEHVSITLNNFKPPTIISYRNSYAFMVSASRAIRAIKLLYGGCTIALDRKVRRAYGILDKYEQNDLRDELIEFPLTF